MGMAAAAAVEPKFHILAVDDNLIDRKLIERLLKKSSCQVTTVDSGSKALEFLGFQKEEDEYEQGSSCSINYPSVSPNSTSSHPKLVSLSPGKKDAEVNLIITDYCMPGMTGYDLLKKIKESSSFRDIPVVIMSSENVPSRINRCLEEGAKEFFLKPVGLSDVNKLKSHMLKAKSGDYFSEQEKHEEGSPRKQPLELQLLEQQSQKQLQEGESDQRTQETASQTHEMHVLIHASQQQLQQQQPLPPTSTNNSKRASSSSSSMDEELSPDNRKRPRYSGLSVA